MTSQAHDEAVLLPCPFCGSAASGPHLTGVSDGNGDFYEIECSSRDCSAHISERGSDATISAWNTRALKRPVGVGGDVVAKLARYMVEDISSAESVERMADAIRIAARSAAGDTDIPRWELMSLTIQGLYRTIALAAIHSIAPKATPSPADAGLLIPPKSRR